MKTIGRDCGVTEWINFNFNKLTEDYLLFKDSSVLFSQIAKWKHTLMK